MTARCYTIYMKSEKAASLKWILWLFGVPLSIGLGLLSAKNRGYEYSLNHIALIFGLPFVFIIAAVRQYLGKKVYFWRIMGVFIIALYYLTAIIGLAKYSIDITLLDVVFMVALPTIFVATSLRHYQGKKAYFWRSIAIYFIAIILAQFIYVTLFKTQ